MKKGFSLIAIAVVFASCSTIMIVPGQQVAFKYLKGKKVVLSERPGAEDSIVINVIKKVTISHPELNSKTLPVKSY